MKKLGMLKGVAFAMLVIAMATTTGCHLSRADAWDDRHKKVPVTRVETQLSQTRVAAGQAVSVRCAVLRGTQTLTDVDTTLQIEPEQAVTQDPADPHAHTLVLTAVGTYRITCAVATAGDAAEADAATGGDVARNAQGVQHTATLQVDAAPASRSKVALVREAIAGERVMVRCLATDAFGNPVPHRDPFDAAPGFSVAPADPTLDVREASFVAKRAGTYHVTCNAHGTMAASNPDDGQIIIKPTAPRTWYNMRDKRSAAGAPAVHCVTGTMPATPPYALRDRFNNPITPAWRVQRVSDDGSVEAVAEADTMAPGHYRYTLDNVQEWSDVAGLGHAAFDVVRDPKPPKISIDDTFRKHGQHLCTAYDVHLQTRVSAACGVGAVTINQAKHTIDVGAPEVAVPHTIAAHAWGLHRITVDATSRCDMSTSYTESYISGPRFVRTDRLPEAATVAWQWSEESWRTMLAKAWRHAQPHAPANVNFPASYAVPEAAVAPDNQGDNAAAGAAAADGEDGSNAAGQSRWGYLNAAKQLIPWNEVAGAWRSLTGTRAAMPAVGVQHVGPLSWTDFDVTAFSIDAQGQLVARATWKRVDVPGRLTSGPNTGARVGLRLPEVKAAITATVHGTDLADVRVQVDPGEPGVASLITAPRANAAANADAQAEAAAPAPQTLPPGLAAALQTAFLESATQALQTVRRDLFELPPNEFDHDAVPTKRRITATAALAAKFEEAWVQEARAKYDSGAWNTERGPGAVVHGPNPRPKAEQNPSADRLLYSDDGINALLWSVWAADGFMTQDGEAPLREVGLVLPLVWMPNAAPGGAMLGVSSRVSVEAHGQTYDGSVQGTLPMQVVWHNNNLQVQAHPTFKPDWIATADTPDQAVGFAQAVEGAELGTWIMSQVNQTLRVLPRPVLMGTLPQGCIWQLEPHGLRRAGNSAWTEVRGKVRCP